MPTFAEENNNIRHEVERGAFEVKYKCRYTAIPIRLEGSTLHRVGFFLHMSKRNYLILDIERSAKLRLNATDCILASAFYELLSQNPIQYNGRPYYLADYDLMSKYRYILPDKTDTIRRLYKHLEMIGLIRIVKINNHVYFSPSQMLINWGLLDN